MRDKIIIALAGNPNSGKTTIFNNLVGANEHVGNWPGVTVVKKCGKAERGGCEIEVVDLPGTYSLTAFTMEEIVSRDFIVDEKPDVVVNIVDASNLERNLYLTMQLRELGAKVVVALNMFDMAEQQGIRIDAIRLEKLLGVAVVPTVGNKNRGMDRLIDEVLAVADARKKLANAPIRYGKELEDHLGELAAIAEKDDALAQKYGAKWLMLKALEKDRVILEMLEASVIWPELSRELDKVEKHLRDVYGDEPDTIIADARYGFIAGAVKEAVKRPQNRRSISDMIDKVATNRFLGLPIFLLAIWLMFNLTFTVGEVPMAWLETIFGWLGDLLDPMADGQLKSLLVDGIIGGVGGVAGFFPLIFMLFLFIAFLEDSGYMARAAFIMDRIMSSVGLHGKSFIPMIVGFGCTVPAIYATRTLENKKDRLITMLVAPLMSCGARLPVYVLLIGAFFSTRSENFQANLLTGIYVLGIVLAIIMAKLFRKTVLPGEGEPFVMELPPYRMPTLKGMLIHAWEMGWMYLKKAGTVILAISVIMWAAMSFPDADNSEYESLMEKMETAYAQKVSVAGQSPELTLKFENAKRSLDNHMASRDMEASIAGSIGKGMEPFIRPLGFDWRVGISLLAGFAAKEVVVGTLGTIFSLGDEQDEGSESLREKIGKDPKYSPAMGLALMVFTLIYLPCMVAMAVWHKEAGSQWKWTLFLIFYTTTLAWIMAFATYNIAPAFGIEKASANVIQTEAETPWSKFLVETENTIALPSEATPVAPIFLDPIADAPAQDQPDVPPASENAAKPQTPPKKE
jgi:ferrous iron transport protein B